MAKPTAAQCQKATCTHRIGGPLSSLHAGAPRLDGAQNVSGYRHIDATESGQSVQQEHTAFEYSGFIPPTATDYAHAPIGSIYREYSADSSQATSLYDARIWVNTAGGWQAVQTQNIAYGTLTTAQILALNATAIVLIAAPGAGKSIVIDSAIGMVDYATAAYAGIAAGEDMVLRYTDGSGAILCTFETTGWLDQTADTFCASVGASHVLTANAGIFAHMLVDEITTGDSPVRFQIRYRVVDLTKLAISLAAGLIG